MEQKIAVVDFDDAVYLGSEQDGVYFDAAEQGGKWHMSASVDCNTGHFCQPILADDGPYDSRSEALLAGLSAAYEWLVNNHVRGWRKDYAKLSRAYRKQQKEAK